MARLAITSLGTFEVTLDGQPVMGFESNKVRALLVYLAVEAGQPHSRDALMTLLWPEQAESAARVNFRRALMNLRQALGDRRDAQVPFLRVERDSVQLNSDSDFWVDVTTFSQLIATNEAHSHRRLETCRACLSRLRQAVALYRGSFLSSFFLSDSETFEEWALLQRERLHRQAVLAFHALAAYYERRGDYAQAEPFARRQLSLDPWREEAHQQLMRILVLSGQRSSALAQYETVRRVLDEQLGAEPAAETSALYNQIRRSEPDAPITPELLAHPALHPHNLPPQATPFVGRETELAQASELLEQPSCRLLTLCGPGGIGKTRFAIQVASEFTDTFTHGVFFVPLGALTSPDFLASALIEALKLTFYDSRDPTTHLLSYLQDKEMLLVLDSFEQLLRSNEERTTEDERRRTEDEGRGRADDEQKGEDTLYASRFTFHASRFTPRASDFVADLLQRAPRLSLLVTSRERLNIEAEWIFELQGLPTPAVEGKQGIETYSAVQVFLNSARRAQPHFALASDQAPYIAQICRAVEGLPLAIELAAGWVRMLSCQEIAQELSRSLDLLVPVSAGSSRQRTLRAVFDPSWNLVSSQEQGTLRQLAVFRGGFVREAAEQVARATLPLLMGLMDKSLLRRTPSGRYSIHEVVRQFAHEKLVNAGEFEATSQRHALYYLNLAERLDPLLFGVQQAAGLNQLEEEHDNLRAAMDWALGSNEQRAMSNEETTGDEQKTEGTKFAHGVRQSAEDVPYELRITNYGLRLSVALFRFWRLRSHLSEGRTYLEAAIRKFEDRGWRIEDGYTILYPPSSILHSLSAALFSAGYLAIDQRDYGQALKWSTQSLELARALDNKQQMGNALHNLGRIRRNQGDYAAANASLKESLSLLQEVKDAFGVAMTTNQLAWLAMRQEQDDRAKALWEQMLALCKQSGNDNGSAIALRSLGHLALSHNDFAQARLFLEEALLVLRRLNEPISLASTLANLGKLILGQGQGQGAAAYFAEALHLARAIGHREQVADLLEAFAAVAVVRGQPEQAALLFGAAESLWTALHATRDRVAQGVYEQSMTHLHTQLDASSLAHAWAIGCALSLEQAAAYALEDRR